MITNEINESMMEQLITELKQINIDRIRQYCTEKREVKNIFSIDMIENKIQTEKDDNIKCAYTILNQSYAQQLGIRGDGNCFYRSIMLMYIINLVLSEDEYQQLNKNNNNINNSTNTNNNTQLYQFIQKIKNLKNIRLEYAQEIIHTEDLQTIFLIFLIKLYIWKQDKINITIQMIINEYNSFPEVDFALTTICRFIIYQTFINVQNHPAFQVFIEDDIKNQIPKLLLKNNEYAEDIIIPLASQALQCELTVQNFYPDHRFNNNKFNTEKLTYLPQIQYNNNNNSQQQIKLQVLFMKDHYDILILRSQYNQYNTFFKCASTKFTGNYQNINSHINFLLLQKYKRNSQFALPQQVNPSSIQLQQSQNQSNIQSSSNLSVQQQQNNKQQQQQSFGNNNEIKQQSEIKIENKQNQIPMHRKQQSLDFVYLKVINQNNNNTNQINELNSEQLNCISCTKKILSFSQFYKVKNKNGQISTICRFCHFKITKTLNQTQSTFLINNQEYSIINQDQLQENQQLQQQSNPLITPNYISFSEESLSDDDFHIISIQPKTTKNKESNSQIQQIHTQRFNSNIIQSQNKPDIKLQSTKSQENEIKNNNFFDNNQQTSNLNNLNNINNINNNDKNQIPLIESAFMVDQYSQQTQIIQKTDNINKSKVQIGQNKNQKIQKNQIAPILNFIDDLDDSDDEEEKTNINNNNSNKQNKNNIQNQEKKNEKEIDRTKCINCLESLQGTRYILKGKQMVLLCFNCLEIFLIDIKKDQKSIIINKETYKFGDSILARIKEKFIIEKEFKKELPQLQKQSQSQPPISSLQPHHMNKKSQSTNQTNSNSNNLNNQQIPLINQINYNSAIQSQNNINQNQNNTQINQNNNNNNNPNNNNSNISGQCLIYGNTICQQCNKQVDSSYEVIQMKEQKEEQQGVCQECLPLFVLYYEYPQQYVKFGGNLYKISANFGKYLRYIQLNQEQRLKLECIVCKHDCRELFRISSERDPKDELYIGKNCFKLNLGQIHENVLIYNSQKYILSDNLAKLGQKYIRDQLYIYAQAVL